MNKRRIKYTVLTALFCAVTPFVQAQPLASLSEGKHMAPRKLRYTPDGEDFVIINGNRKFNRALYGSHSGFRLETGDVPEFALYLPRMGGNLSFGIVNGRDSIALNNAKYIESRYRPGSRIYKIADPLLGRDTLYITALSLPDADGAIWKIEASNLLPSVKLTWRFGGAADKRFSREGDLGVDPPNSFELKPEYCTGNIYDIDKNNFSLTFGQKSKTGERTLFGTFPQNALLITDELPVLHGQVNLEKEQYVFITLDEALLTTSMSALFEKSESARRELAGRIKFNTPDPFFNTIGGALAVAADGIWDGQVWLHGAVGWRMPLSGWRAAYTGDFLGWHDRARTHFDAYAASQVTNVPNTIPHPAQDPDMNLARSIKKWGTPQYSNGYICRNPRRPDQMHHYDMNLCYIDELLWHLNWTGDLNYARSMWPVLTRHLAWEKLNFDPDNDGLYDAYACIWASDALYYNSGAVTHSTAYNYRANKMAAEIAEKIGENSEPYHKEADKILKALNSRLWLTDKGYWAEFQDFMGHKRLHESAGVWTIYHAIDSDVADPFQAYQATRYVDTAIPHIPVKAEGLKDEGYQTISTTNWLPYSWSINNVAFAEVMHTALSYFQAGRGEDGYKLLKSSVLDGMYLGGSPGNFGQVSFYDAARGECYRDFGDPVGVASRVFIQGLFGIVPDAMNQKLIIKPGFPAAWPYASLETPDLTFNYNRENNVEVYKVDQSFSKPLTLELHVRAQRERISKISVNGKPAEWHLVEPSVDYPLIKIIAPAELHNEVEIEWAGSLLAYEINNLRSSYNAGEDLEISFPVNVKEVFDPQKVLKTLRVSFSQNKIISDISAEPGSHTFFVKLQHGDMQWWQPVNTFINEQKKEWIAPFADVNTELCETVKIDKFFNASVTDIFKNEYLTPRSPYTTLQLPVQGIGEWCHPKTMADIGDSGIRSLSRNGILETNLGIPFRTPASGKNIAFTSLWDNYPDSLKIPLSGKASKLYLMMAGSTNHMQCHIVNGTVRVFYKDGTSEVLELINPETWCPIEQDFFVDNQAFKLKTPAPYRIYLKSGLVSNDLGKDLTISGVYGRPIDGGAGVLHEIGLDTNKKLDYLQLETISNDVVIGIMSLTLQR